MRWLQVTDLEGGVHIGLREGEKIRILREPHEAVATTLDLLEAEQAHRLDAETWVQSAEHSGVFDRVSWADLVGERLGHPLTVPLTPPEAWGPGVTYKRSPAFRQAASAIYAQVAPPPPP